MTTLTEAIKEARQVAKEVNLTEAANKFFLIGDGGEIAGTHVNYRSAGDAMAPGMMLFHGTLQDAKRLARVIARKKVMDVVATESTELDESEMSLKSNEGLWKRAMDQAKKAPRDAFGGNYLLDFIKGMNPKKLSRSDIDALKDILGESTGLGDAIAEARRVAKEVFES